MSKSSDKNEKPDKADPKKDEKEFNLDDIPPESQRAFLKEMKELDRKYGLD